MEVELDLSEFQGTVVLHELEEIPSGQVLQNEEDVLLV